MCFDCDNCGLTSKNFYCITHDLRCRTYASVRLYVVRTRVFVVEMEYHKFALLVIGALVYLPGE